MREYAMKADLNDPQVQLQSRTSPKGTFYDQNKQLIIDLDRRVQDNRLDLRGVLPEGQQILGVLQFMRTSNLRILVLSNWIIT